MTDIIKINSKFPIKMTIKQFKLWYMDNKESVLKLSTKYINHRILIVDDKKNEYKYIRRGTEARIVPRERMKSKQQIIDDVERLKTLFNELEFMEDKLRHYGDLLVMKGIDVEEETDTRGRGLYPPQRYQSGINERKAAPEQTVPSDGKTEEKNDLRTKNANGEFIRFGPI